MCKKSGCLLASAVLLAAALWVLTTCELFNDKPEIDLLKAIDERVKTANAKVLNVEITGNGHGVIQWGGQAKLDVPFNVNFTIYEGYYFSEWRAYLGTLPSNDLEADRRNGEVEVVFDSPQSRETSVRIKTDTGTEKLYIVAWTDNVPSIFEDLKFARFTEEPNPPLKDDQGNTVLLKGTIRPNTYMQLEFSRPMDQKSFILGETVTLKSKNDDNPNYYAPDSENLLPAFMSLDKTVVTFYLDPSRGDEPGWPGGKYFYPYSLPFQHIFQIGGDVRDIKGIPLGRSAQYRFETIPHSDIIDDRELDLEKPESVDVDAWTRISDVSAALKSGDPLSPEKIFIYNHSFDLARPDIETIYVMMLFKYGCQPVMGFRVFEGYYPPSTWPSAGIYRYGGDYYTPHYNLPIRSPDRTVDDENVLAILRAAFMEKKRNWGTPLDEELGKYAFYAFKYTLQTPNDVWNDEDILELMIEPLVYADLVDEGPREYDSPFEHKPYEKTKGDEIPAHKLPPDCYTHTLEIIHYYNDVL
ncbi:hypothetical protein AGMMS50293_00410 [Spirochaetia bacterium]|nr:hypothetical protein AGMMS50293_00410 [Spirochaetia bacterium]